MSMFPRDRLLAHCVASSNIPAFPPDPEVLRKAIESFLFLWNELAIPIETHDIVARGRGCSPISRPSRCSLSVFVIGPVVVNGLAIFKRSRIDREDFLGTGHKSLLDGKEYIELAT